MCQPLLLDRSPLRAQLQAAWDSMGASMPSPKSSGWVSLGAGIFRLILQDLLGKARTLPSPQQMGWQTGAWGRVTGLFSLGDGGVIFGHLGRKIKRKREWALSPPKPPAPLFSEASV